VTCPCLYPLVIVKGKKYYLAFPDDETDYIDKLESDGTKPSFTEIKNTDDGDSVKYLAYPEKHVQKVLGKLDINLQKFEGNDYIAVNYKTIESSDHMKQYLTNEHIVFAGCSSPVKVGAHGLKCDSKEIYLSLHPINEWTEHHVIYK
jgi:hypothetical protein